MKWKLSFAQKIRATLALVVVFLLVLATNVMDSHHFEVVQQSLKTVYEDRLLAKNYIYKIGRQLQAKEYAATHSDNDTLTSMHSQANDSIKVLVEKFANTKLTKVEAEHLESLQKNLKQMYKYEEQWQEGEIVNEEVFSIEIAESHYSTIMQDLDALSEIQIKEGEREINNSNRAIDASNLISRLEIGALIFIGFLIQLLIFVKPLK